MNYTQMTISQVEQEKSSSVWVINTSSKDHSGKGIINLTIVEGNGSPSVVRIPVTDIPVDLTLQATKSALMMSPNFRRIVASRIVALVSDDEAIKLLDNDQARAEQRRLLNIDEVHRIQDDQFSPQVASIVAESSGKIGGIAMNIAHTTDGDEETVLVQLRNNISLMSKDELQYIVNNSVFHKVKAFAAEHIVG